MCIPPLQFQPTIVCGVSIYTHPSHCVYRPLIRKAEFLTCSLPSSPVQVPFFIYISPVSPDLHSNSTHSLAPILMYLIDSLHYACVYVKYMLYYMLLIYVDAISLYIWFYFLCIISLAISVGCFVDILSTASCGHTQHIWPCLLPKWQCPREFPTSPQSMPQLSPHLTLTYYI